MITVLYEDADVLVADKPSGVLVHEAEGESATETVAEWFLKHSPEAKGVGEKSTLPSGKEVERSGVVHRLDRDTSGVLILAKTQKAFEHLKAQFHDHLAHKEYRAFVHGPMQKNGQGKWGVIDRPIGRSKKDFRLRSAQRGAQGTLRPAITEWELIAENGVHAYLKVFPKTGRTHQIRVHLKAINHPIVCDAQYAPSFACELGLGRLGLHAFALEVVLLSGEKKRFESALPPSFIAAAESLAQSK